MSLDRRTFLKTVAIAGAATATEAQASAGPGPRTRAVLVDTTLCVGCRACEAACSEENALAEPALAGDERVFAQTRDTATGAYTVVNRVTPEGVEHARFVKRQCMHCLEPACASACLVRALEKTAAGPVVYHADRCLGCRYCMVACPFGVPRFEYDKPVPYVRKCDFCARRQALGKPPACAEVCPSGALLYGDRAELIDAARTRIYQNPEKYVHAIYGEQDVGGTSWLYIGDVPFERMGFKTDLGTAPAAGYAQSALSGVPIMMTVGPAVLMSLYSFAERRRQSADTATAEGERHG